MSFIGQSYPDIKRKLKRLEGLQDLTVRDLVKEAEKVYHKRETEEEKREREGKEREETEDERDRCRDQNLTRILAAVVPEGNRNVGRKTGNLGNPRHRNAWASQNWRFSRIDKDQCRYCKNKGHWAQDCPYKKEKMQGPKTLALRNEDD